MDGSTNQKVGLGCGTLILIALIVMIFSNSGTRGLDGQIRDLNREVQSLRSQMDDQIRRLTRKVNDLESQLNLQTRMLRSIETALRAGNAKAPTPVEATEPAAK